jgi:hypothetical protein
VAGEIRTATDASARLVRLPLWSGLGPERTERVIAEVTDAVRSSALAAA